MRGIHEILSNKNKSKHVSDGWISVFGKNCPILVGNKTNEKREIRSLLKKVRRDYPVYRHYTVAM